MQSTTRKYKGSNIILTGGTGFLGTHVYHRLRNLGYTSITQLGSNTYKGNLLKAGQVDKMFKFSTSRAFQEPEVVINLAAVVGGIGANRDNSPEFMLKNLLMNINLINALIGNKNFRENGRFVQIGTVCAYPKYAQVPFKEERLWAGYPEETNAGYGIAKRTIMELLCQYEKHRGFDAINLIPVNLYGPGDNFNDKSSHVIPALIKRILKAKKDDKKYIIIWGTGNATREFIYVEDAAEAIVDAMEFHVGSDPINIGTGNDIKIRDLVDLICNIIGYDGEIRFDHSKPDGQPVRKLDVSKAEKSFGFKAKTSLEHGLRKTIEWYKEKCTE